MRVFMLGWEFPPFITGGLGTACYGLTRAMDAQKIGVIFVMPGATDPNASSHVDLLSPETIGHSGTPMPMSTPPPKPSPTTPPITAPTEDMIEHDEQHPEFSQRVEFIQLPVKLLHPYDPDAADQPVGTITEHDQASRSKDSASTQSAQISDDEIDIEFDLEVDDHKQEPTEEHTADEGGNTDYSSNVMTQVRRFASFARAAGETRSFDVIHAHDWMTYPAGLEVARRTGRPLVVHVHSTEFDRSGEQVNQQIYDIERRGMHGAMRVITVSRLTRDIVIRRYGINPDKVTVVYNGVAIDPIASGVKPIGRREKIVLYFGRITRQKGPEYFIRAAKRVLEVEPSVRFIVAGSGDLYRRCIELAAELGIGQHFLFTGFLRGPDIEKVFAMADLFVMPSVSEPFGIAPLEAMGHNVPVLISKSSGASEVLTHALKCDFWDTEAMADKIVAVLRHPPLGQTLRRHGVIDIRRLTWADAAAKCGTVYEEVAAAMPRR
ncbi:MAG: glycosyltransferase family 4 protein [Phycisphaerales bacterium]|nr:glycosyltransferase family 4 protein [Phycisphaerales bacterium]